MKTLYNFIIEPLNGVLYDNVKKIGDSDLIMSSSIENHEMTNRHAIVVSAPIYYDGPIKNGDTIIVHHNVFRKYYDAYGEEKYAAGLITDNKYSVEIGQIFLYKSEGDDWQTFEPYCFVSPIANDDGMANVSEKELYGIMEYTTPYIDSIGIKSGDRIAFRPDSEYEFNIDGKKMYRVNSNNICLKI